MRRPDLLAACLLPWLALSGCALFGGGGGGRTYVVFFNAGSGKLDEASRGVVGRAADAAADKPANDVLVEGYAGAGAHGSDAREVALSAQRAETVASALRADGVAANRIRVRTRDPAREDAGVGVRRVDIEFGP